jgi:hypothetical protein
MSQFGEVRPQQGHHAGGQDWSGADTPPQSTADAAWPIAAGHQADSASARSAGR